MSNFITSVELNEIASLLNTLNEYEFEFIHFYVTIGDSNGDNLGYLDTRNGELTFVTTLEEDA